MHDITLQFNLSQADISFASRSIPPLVEAHRGNADEVFAIVDCCRSRRAAKAAHPPIRYGGVGNAGQDRHSLEAQHQQRIKEICAIAEELKNKGYLDRVIYLHENDPALTAIYRRYLNNIIRSTHEFSGRALVAYLLALDACRSRYLIHYDADIFLCQAPGYDWAAQAKDFIAQDPIAVDASPRISPPFAEYRHLPDAPSLKWGKPEFCVKGYWYSTWFSSRCFLIDRQKLFRYLPLVKGSQVELLVRKFLKRSFPWDFERLVSRRMARAGTRRLVLASPEAWIVHPAERSERYLELLPRIQEAIAEGRLPLEQRGQEDIDLGAWEKFF